VLLALGWVSTVQQPVPLLAPEIKEPDEQAAQQAGITGREGA
jgi:hypothetical protein